MRGRSLALIAGPFAAAVLAAAAAALRFDLIENESLAPLCLQDSPPSWCGWSGILNQLFRSQTVGLASLVMIGLAVISMRRRRDDSAQAWAMAAMAVGVVAVAFGNAAPAAFSAVLALAVFIQAGSQRPQQR